MKETFKQYAERAVTEFQFKNLAQVRRFRKYSEMAIAQWPMELFWYVQGCRCMCGDDIFHAIAYFCMRKDAKKYLSI